MKLCRFATTEGDMRVGLVDENTTQLIDLTAAGVSSLTTILESPDPVATVQRAATPTAARLPLANARLLAPVDKQEVWAAGVTYLRSKTARMEESDFSASAYDRVYAAERPELFFKALPQKVVPPLEPVGIRRDARWNVPEPELALVINSRGIIVGYTIGNDMSSRDIEGENVLYLPQAKIYDRSCALGPFIRLAADETEARTWRIELTIERAGAPVFSGQTTVSQIKRSFVSLADFLFRSQTFPAGAILLTGTGVVPPDGFTLQPGDSVRIHVSGIGDLINPVISV
jgi:2-dehydro-3-deoxy-D-arabinonate dehydratase